jgi:hypothetical protein
MAATGRHPACQNRPGSSPLRGQSRIIERNTMWNIIIGLVMIIGGATGKLALRGTHSSGALVVIGVLLLGWGVFSMTRNRQ